MREARLLDRAFFVALGTIHASEIVPMTCPDVSREAARAIANFARD